MPAKNGWIRKPEYQEISEKIYMLWDKGVTSWNGVIITTLKDLAHHCRRSETVIQQIKNTRDHEDYCRQYNKRQWFSKYCDKVSDHVKVLKKETSGDLTLSEKLDMVLDELYQLREIINTKW